MKREVSVLLLFLFILLSGCTGPSITGEVKKPEIVIESSEPPRVYFCPQDECRKHLGDLIKSSEEYVHCAFFDLDLKEIIDGLEREDIDIKLVIDKRNSGEVKELNPMKNSDTNQLMHNKFCVIDGRFVSTGSFNPTERGNFYNNNNLVIISSRYLAQNYEEEFEELWNGKFGWGKSAEYPILYLNGNKIENYFCPEDSCAEHVVNVLNDAQENIYFMTFSFTHDDIGNTLIQKHDVGVDVRGVIEKTRKSEWSEYDKLKENGIDVKWDDNKYVMHHKVFIIDNKTVITGSFNPTKSGDEDNDENILIIHDPTIARKYLEEYERIWNFKDELDKEEGKSDSIMISEVYYDTSGKDAEEEFVELYNPTNTNVNLDYYSISNGKNNQRLDGIIKAKSIELIKPKFLLKNKGGMIVLKKSFDQVDFVSWESLWDIEAKKGESLQRKSFEMVNSEREWYIGRPNPGKVEFKNS